MMRKSTSVTFALLFLFSLLAFSCDYSKPVDLGLPSGTLWMSSNERGYYNYENAIKKFGDNMPTYDQWKELWSFCQWTWDDVVYQVVGPNGNEIFFPANGYYNDNINKKQSVGSVGFYWASDPHGYSSWAHCFDLKERWMDPINNYHNLSVRLVINN